MKKYAKFSMWIAFLILAPISLARPEHAPFLVAGFVVGALATVAVFWGFGCISRE